MLIHRGSADLQMVFNQPHTSTYTLCQYNGTSLYSTSNLCAQVTKIDGAIKHAVRCEDVGDASMRSQLLIYNVSRDDVGLYSCNVNNGISPPSQSQVKLFSTCESRPHLDFIIFTESAVQAIFLISFGSFPFGSSLDNLVYINVCCIHINRRSFDFVVLKCYGAVQVKFRVSSVLFWYIKYEKIELVFSGNSTRFHIVGDACVIMIQQLRCLSISICETQ